MTVSVRSARGSDSDRLWIGDLYRDYLDDLSGLNSGIFPILGEVGHREPDQIARWFSERDTFPLVILQTAERVGFALVVRTGLPALEYRMAEFFIVRARRRLGIGRTAVQLILNRFAGTWEVTEHLRNPAAVNFWRRVLAGYTRGRYQERVINGEVQQLFDSRVQRAR